MSASSLAAAQRGAPLRRSSGAQTAQTRQYHLGPNHITARPLARRRNHSGAFLWLNAPRRPNDRPQPRPPRTSAEAPALLRRTYRRGPALRASHAALEGRLGVALHSGRGARHQRDRKTTLAIEHHRTGAPWRSPDAIGTLARSLKTGQADEGPFDWFAANATNGSPFFMTGDTKTKKTLDLLSVARVFARSARL